MAFGHFIFKNHWLPCYITAHYALIGSQYHCNHEFPLPAAQHRRYPPANIFYRSPVRIELNLKIRNGFGEIVVGPGAIMRMFLLGIFVTLTPSVLAFACLLWTADDATKVPRADGKM